MTKIIDPPEKIEEVPMPERLRVVVDGASITTVAATITGWLPAIAALLSIVWTVIRIYETRTVQGWLGRKPLTRRSDAEG